MVKKVDLTRATECGPDEIGATRDLFDYHDWDDEQRKNGEIVRNMLCSSYQAIINAVPPCPTRTRALNLLLDARMLANSAIMHKGKY
jgi:ferredoxin